MPRSRRYRKGGATRRRRRGGATRRSRGGNAIAATVSALKTALPSIVLYEALRMQGKRVKRRRGGRTKRGGRTRRGGRRRRRRR